MKICLFLLMVALTLTACFSQDNQILVKNNTAKTLKSVTVSVCDSCWVIENLAPGEYESFFIVYSKDDSYQITVEYENTSTLEGNFGYVTQGLSNERIRISIEEESISFMQY